MHYRGGRKSTVVMQVYALSESWNLNFEMLVDEVPYLFFVVVAAVVSLRMKKERVWKFG